MLGVAVTCTNKQTFINKIQSLDETAQVLYKQMIDVEKYDKI